MPDIMAPYRESMKAFQETMDKLRPSMTRLGEETSALFQVMGEVAIDATDALNTALSNGAEGLGEFLGAMLTGHAGVKDFGKLIITTFADLAINVGKIAIGAGLAVLGIKEALMTLNPAVAIGAGILLVALGSAIKGALSSVAGGSASASLASGGSGGTYTYDTGKPAPLQIVLSGEFTQKGSDLVAVVNNENMRKYTNT
jgi:hypothetical protein